MMKTTVYTKRFLLVALMVLTATFSANAVKVHMCGDSMMSIYGNESSDTDANDTYNQGMRGWGQFFGEYVNLTVQDWAHTGTSAKGFYSGNDNFWKVVMGDKTMTDEYKAERPYVVGYTPVQAGDYVILCWGHNDQKGGDQHNGYRTITESKYTEYLTTMVDEVRDKGAYPILATSICRDLWDGNSLKLLGKIDCCEAAGVKHADGHADDCPFNYPAAARKLANELNVPLIDLNAQITALYETMGKTKTNIFYASGTTHTSETGARTVCRFANTIIRGWVATQYPDYAPLINAMKTNVTVPVKNDFLMESTIGSETVWTFNEAPNGNAYNANDVVANQLVDFNGLYLRGRTSGNTVRAFTAVAVDAAQQNQTFSNGKAVTATMCISTDAPTSNNETVLSNATLTAGADVADGTSRCVAINTSGPGTFHILMRVNSGGTGRVFNLAFNGEIVDTKAISTTATELKYHATEAGVFYAWATKAYNILAVQYVPDADTSEDEMHETDPADPDPETPTVKVPVFITAGQSNTDGRCFNENLPDYIQALSPAYQYCNWSYTNGGARVAANEGVFSKFWPNMAGANNPGRFAYDAILYYWLEQALQSDFYVVKHSFGGTSIDPTCTSSNDYHWSADPTWLAENTSVNEGGKSMIKGLIGNINKSIDAIIAAGYEPDFKCMVWHQGESDRSAADAYHDNLQAVVQHVRNYLVTRTGDNKYATLPFIAGTVPTNSKQYNKKVYDALFTLQTEDPNFHVIETSPGTFIGDNLHFDRNCAERLGINMYNKIIELGLIEGEAQEVPTANVPVDHSTGYDFRKWVAENMDANGYWQLEIDNNNEMTQADGSKVYPITGVTSGVDFSEFADHFAVSNQIALENPTKPENVCVSFRKAGSATNAATGLRTASGRTVAFSIYNLSVGDVVQISCDVSSSDGVHLPALAFVSTNAYLAGDATKTPVAANTEWESDQSYVIASGSQLDLKLGGSGQHYIYKVKVTPSTAIHTAASGFTTLVTSTALDLSLLPEGLSAYYVATAPDVASGVVQLKQLTTAVPGETPLVFHGEPNTDYDILAAAGTPAALSFNSLGGSSYMPQTFTERQVYILSGGQFHPCDAGTFPAGKAYLNASAGASAKSLSLVLPDFVSGINSASLNDNEQTPNGVYYNLAGQRVDAAYKGVRIANGKKQVVK